MGYILPVERYQYYDYHQRTVNEKNNPVYIERPFKVVLEKQHEEITSEYERYLPSSYKSIPLNPQMDNAIDSTTYAELTGKGRAFNETI